MSAMGAWVRPLVDLIDLVSQGLFRVVGIIMVFGSLDRGRMRRLLLDPG
jgi:hypothetical protein